MIDSKWQQVALKEFSSSKRNAALYFIIPKFKEALLSLKSLENEKLKFLFPVKSFNHPIILELVAGISSGFDVSNQNELDSVKPFLQDHHALWNSCPFNRAVSSDMAFHDLNSESGLQSLQDASRISIRITPSFLQPGNRFGLTIDKALMLLKKNPDLMAIHVHLSGIQNTKEDFFTLIHFLHNSLQEITKPLHINLGGGLSYLTLSDLTEVVELAKVILPRHSLYFEPGRWIAKQAGLAMGKVLAVENSNMTVSLSSACHLRWMDLSHDIIISGQKNSLGEKKTYQVYGPTCFEGDKIAQVELQLAAPLEGQLIMINHISGYSYGWNHSFNGIEEADVVFLGN